MKQGINLIPATILGVRARQGRLRVWIGVNVVLLGALGVFWLVARPHTSGLIDRLRSDHEEARGRLASDQEELARAVAALRGARAREAVARRMGARPDFSGLLRTLGEELDTRATLEQVVVAPLALEALDPSRASGAASGAPAPGLPPARPTRERYQLLVNGVALSVGVANDFVLRLDETGYFSMVNLTSTSAREMGRVRAVEFRVTCTLGEGRVADAEDGG